MNRSLENQLVEVLGAEVAVYEQLATIKTQEKEALVAFATPELEACTKIQDLLTKKATEMESRRRRIVRTMAEARGLRKDDFTLREVVEWLSPETAKNVNALGNELRNLFAEIARSQDQNATLIQGATQYIRRLIDSLMARTKQDPFAYGRSGFKATLKETMPGLLDRKA